MLPLGWALTVVTSSPPIAPALPARPGLQVPVPAPVTVTAWSRSWDLAACG
jgi:hypothetical protein